MNILWSHTLSEPLSCEQVWGIYHDDTVHYLKLGAKNTSLSYEIIKHPNHLDDNVIWVDIQGEFQLLPTLFSETTIPGMTQPIKRIIQNQIVLAFEPKPTLEEKLEAWPFPAEEPKKTKPRVKKATTRPAKKAPAAIRTVAKKTAKKAK